jgi:hypothetical protein
LLFLSLGTSPLLWAADDDPVKFWWEAGQNTGQEERRALVPKGQVLLEDVTSLCGSGFLYSVPTGHFTEEEIKWLRTVIRFQYGDSMKAYPVSFQLHVAEPIGWENMEALLKNDRFSKWAGTDIISRIRELGEARLDLQTNAKSLPRCGNDNCKNFFNFPKVKRYTLAVDHLGQALKNIFKVVETDNRVDCN